MLSTLSMVRRGGIPSTMGPYVTLLARVSRVSTSAKSLASSKNPMNYDGSILHQAKLMSERNLGRTVCGFGLGPYRPSGHKVYEGNITTMVKAIKYFSLSTSALGLLLQPLAMKGVVTVGWPFAVGVLCYSLLTPVLFHVLCKRYVVALHFYEGKTFTATTLSLLSFKNYTQFDATDVSVPDVVGPLTSFHVKGKPLLLDPNLFTNKSAYMHLMGYDKPLDLKLNQPKSE